MQHSRECNERRLKAHPARTFVPRKSLVEAEDSEPPVAQHACPSLTLSVLGRVSLLTSSCGVHWLCHLAPFAEPALQHRLRGRTGVRLDEVRHVQHLGGVPPVRGHGPLVSSGGCGWHHVEDVLRRCCWRDPGLNALGVGIPSVRHLRVGAWTVQRRIDRIHVDAVVSVAEFTWQPSEPVAAFFVLRQGTHLSVPPGAALAEGHQVPAFELAHPACPGLEPFPLLCAQQVFLAAALVLLEPPARRVHVARAGLQG